MSDLEINAVGKNEWISSIKSFLDNNYEQSAAYSNGLAQESGADIEFYIASSKSSIIGGASVRIKKIPMLGRGVAYIAGGPLIETHADGINNTIRKDVLSALRKRLVDEDGHTLIVRLPVSAQLNDTEFLPETMQIGFNYSKNSNKYRTIVVNIEPEPEEIRKRLAGKWRTDLNFAQKSNLTIERGSGKAFCDRFRKIYGEMHSVKKFAVRLPPEFFFALPSEEIGLEILIAKKDGQDAAGHVLSMLGDTAVYLFGATNELGRATKAGYLLNWQAMLLARECGLRWYDLGGVDADANPDGYRFKKRTGGQELVAGGPYEARPNGMVGAVIQGALILRNRFGSS